MDGIKSDVTCIERHCSICLNGLYKMDEKESSPSDLQWVERRERVVQQAIDDGDLGKLRELAALPGGFGSNEMRKKVWWVGQLVLQIIS